MQSETGADELLIESAVYGFLRWRPIYTFAPANGLDDPRYWFKTDRYEVSIEHYYGIGPAKFDLRIRRREGQFMITKVTQGCLSKAEAVIRAEIWLKADGLLV